MSHIVQLTKFAISNLIVLVIGILVSGPVHAAESSRSACTASEFRQFDFWAGVWDVYDVGQPEKVAYVQVDHILGGCALREDYHGADGHQGQSFTIYDAARKIWHQSWVTNRGELLILEGNFENGALVLRGEDHAKHSLVRGTWKQEENAVRESAVTSTDGGKTWEPWFDLLFRRAEATSKHPELGVAPASDEEMVATLDAKYQAAVKNNDVDGMSRILADDFVLVTGSGKRFNKSDLLTEARSGHSHYEHQEDTDPTVRVWGNTAIVTAKLWAKGIAEEKPFDYHLWFSDTYIRTEEGWRYVFGQSSLRLPQAP